ncbi:MAG: tetratricopeptide repeat protein, partial [Bacteroidota bacterium]
DAKEGGFDYDIYTNSTLNLTFNLGQFGGLGKMVRNFENVDIAATPAVMERHGNKVDVTVSGQIPEKYFSSKAAMKLSPIVKYNGKSKVLEPIFLRGDKVSGDGQVITSDGGTFSKDYTIDFEEGMEDAELVIESLVFLPKGNPVNEDATNSNIEENYKSEALPERSLATGTIITGQRVAFTPENAAENPYNKSDSPAYGMIAGHGYEKETIISEKATVYFKINLAYLNWRLPLNVDRNAKEDVEELKQFIDKGWEIKDIEINAWASPEGEESFNAGLSERRAKTGHKVLKDLFSELDMDIDEVTVNQQAKGEDWNGFMDAVEASDIEDKEVILNVVRSQPDLEKREQEIRNMALVYEKVEEEILPPLRRAELKVNSYEPKKTDEEMASLAMEDAEELSKAELLYAATLHNDLNDKLDIYQKATELFPGCAKAFNNKGYILMLQGEYDDAKKALKKAESIAPTHGGVLNNLGIIAGIDGEYEEAEEYFAKAKKQGINVSYSMGVLNITKGNYDEALSQMDNKNCDYNVALAHLVNEDTDKAKSTLECAPETAERNYLMAVVGARSDNKEMAFEYLVKAIQADDSYKETAKNDKEFLEYFDMPDFKSMVE